MTRYVWLWSVSVRSAVEPGVVWPGWLGGGAGDAAWGRASVLGVFGGRGPVRDVVTPLTMTVTTPMPVDNPSPAAADVPKSTAMFGPSAAPLSISGIPPSSAKASEASRAEMLMSTRRLVTRRFWPSIVRSNRGDDFTSPKSSPRTKPLMSRETQPPPILVGLGRLRSPCDGVKIESASLQPSVNPMPSREIPDIAKKRGNEKILALARRTLR